MARMIGLMHIPGFPQLISSKFFWRMRHINAYIPGLGVSSYNFQIYFQSTQLKIKPSAWCDCRGLHAPNQTGFCPDAGREGCGRCCHFFGHCAKRDIMSLLVRARIADKGEGYQMSDRAMMDQVVSQQVDWPISEADWIVNTVDFPWYMRFSLKMIPQC